jgi:hypothetical protein
MRIVCFDAHRLGVIAGLRVRVTIAGLGPALEASVHDALGRSWTV